MKSCDKCKKGITEVSKVRVMALFGFQSKSLTVKGDYCKECALKKAEELSGEVFR